jgi:hypothetical protein
VSLRPNDFPGLDARSANRNATWGAIHDGPDPLDVRVPTTLSAPVGVRHAVPEARALATDFAGCRHSNTPDRQFVPIRGEDSAPALRATEQE